MATSLLFCPEKRLVTAHILYHLPDYPDILQLYLWQDIDKTPDYPTLKKFLDYWNRHLEGRLHSVQIAASEQQAHIGASEYRFYEDEFLTH
jgi:uncharacterized protein Usg